MCLRLGSIYSNVLRWGRQGISSEEIACLKPTTFEFDLEFSTAAVMRSMESGWKFGAAGAGGSGLHATPLGVKGEGGMVAGSDAICDKGKNIPSTQPANDRGRQIVLDVNSAAQGQKEDEDEYVFEEDKEAVKMQPRWMAIARYYSGKPYSTWGMFSELSSIWGKKESILVRELGNNRFLVEFDSERL